MKYIGITLGPIDRIAQYSRSTRSIWASSYIFSFLAKKIVEKLLGKYTSYKIKKEDFLKPVITDDMLNHSPIGRFPDQYVFKVNDNSVLKTNNVYEIAEKILDDIADNIKKDDKEIKKIIKQVIKVYVVEKTYETQPVSVVEDFQAMFDAMECRDAYVMQGYENKFAEYFDKTDTILLTEAYKEKGNNDYRMFTSILECSAGKELDQIEENNTEYTLAPYQKYIAFVAADGDYFGKTISCDTTNSSLLDKFNQQLREKVEGYGGQVIFQGGDDVLFFAPIFSPKEKDQNSDQESQIHPQDIFSLINEIDRLFETEVLKNIDENSKSHFKNMPSFSYGVAIAYYKHPMAETRARALQLLHDCKENGRNAIKWEVMKHSGQTYGGMIKKNAPGTETEQLKQMLNIIKNSTSDVDNNFLHSITHWLIKNGAILTHILQQSDKKDLLNNYFDNSFDEPVHDKKTDFINAIKSFLLIEGLEKPHEKLHALLRYVELLLNKS